MKTGLEKFYQKIDCEVSLLVERNSARLNCRRGCSSCCVDDLTVFEIEAENIRQNYRELLENDSPHEAGKCAFLDEAGGCRIYSARPYVCRTQGLPLRWLEEIEDEMFELRDICPLNDTSEPIEELPAEDCWTLGEAESDLALMQLAKNGEMRRVPLRDLFVKK